MKQTKFYRYHKYHVLCTSCGLTTTRRHAHDHAGRCKQCSEVELAKAQRATQQNEFDSEIERSIYANSTNVEERNDSLHLTKSFEW